VRPDHSSKKKLPLATDGDQYAALRNRYEPRRTGLTGNPGGRAPYPWTYREGSESASGPPESIREGIDAINGCSDDA